MTEIVLGTTAKSVFKRCFEAKEEEKEPFTHKKISLLSPRLSNELRVSRLIAAQALSSIPRQRTQIEIRVSPTLEADD